jgi:acetyl esterase/lipase
MRKLAILLLLAFSSSLYAQQGQVIRVWPGKAPGSEDWAFNENVQEGRDGSKTYSNVVDPTLTAFLPDPAKANGITIIICPGGGFRALDFSEPERTAAWLNSKGIAAFILKYRVVPSAATAQPAGAARGQASWQRDELSLQEILKRHGNANPVPSDQEQIKVIAMGIADGQQAIRLLRRNAAQYHIDPKRIGIMGFSAGGGVAIGTALAEVSDAYPDFVVSVYGPSLVDVNVPKEAAPLFITVADNHFNVTNGCSALFALWKEAGRPVEMHVYDHGTGVSMGIPVPTWTDRLYDWLRMRKLLTD